MTKQSATRVDGDRIVLTNATDERGILVPLTNVDVERRLVRERKKSRSQSR
jgi:hypothetical protein